MSRNNGKELEKVFVLNTNGKKIKDVPVGLRENLEHMFKFLKEDDVIHSELIQGMMKPDFFIEINGVRKNISLKTGVSTELGDTDLKTFITFLRDNGISEDTLKTIVYLHFSDGTLNDTGRTRYDFETFRKLMDQRIIRANIELNRSKELIKKLVYLTVYKGFYEGNIEANYIYFGTHNHGYCCNYRQMCRMIDGKKYAYIHNLHIGPVQFRPLARYTRRAICHEEKRWKVRFFWSGLESEIEKIGRNFKYQHDGYITVEERKQVENKNA